MSPRQPLLLTRARTRKHLPLGECELKKSSHPNTAAVTRNTAAATPGHRGSNSRTPRQQLPDTTTAIQDTAAATPRNYDSHTAVLAGGFPLVAVATRPPVETTSR
ncbi:hypothetical protein [Haloferax larsenii]|uniref:hypothetical protein n=1 Tax=Haloferax larsenii TaxID=302484 RepID=UPI0011145990|nr:hypothetical protein [Haloferax larsenii]